MKKYAYLIKPFIRCILCISLMSGQFASAEAADIDFAGFASLVYAKTLTDDSKEGTAGVLGRIHDEGEYRDFNKLGLRMNASLKDNVSFTAQMIAEGVDDYDPTFDWLFVTYSITPEVSITAGKYRVPVFMYSDYLDTSYAYQWLIPPITVYNAAQTPFKSMEGLKLSYVADLGGDWSSELLLFGGKSKDDFKVQGLDTQLRLENAIGFAWTVDWNWLAMRAFYLGADSSADLTTNPDLLEMVDQIAGVEQLTSGLLNRQVEVQDDLLWENDYGQFYGLGASVDFGMFFAVSELTRIEVESNLAVPVLNSFYLMLGYRPIPSVSLSITYGKDKDEAVKDTWQQFDRYISNNPQSGSDEEMASNILAFVQSEVRSKVEDFQNYELENYTLSARWNVYSQVSVKCEYLMQESEENNSGNVHKPRAFYVGLDLVF